MTRSTHQRPRGFVLPTALIFLIIMTLVGITAIRRATSEEKISGNIRAQSLAFQAAEAALRYCQKDLENSAPNGRLPLDTGVIVTVGSIPIVQYVLPATPSADPPLPTVWADRANWTNTNSFTLPANTVINVAAQPQCMIEEWPIAVPGGGVKKAYLITARGVGAVDTAVVWLQATLRPGTI
ncbi:MAG: hypothetical protein K2Y28_15585 [Burkholderiaceae bacterium]|nr:hypothetical protein [Burkholderiaceae bacterium]